MRHSRYALLKWRHAPLLFLLTFRHIRYSCIAPLHSPYDISKSPSCTYHSDLKEMILAQGEAPETMRMSVADQTTSQLGNRLRPRRKSIPLCICTKLEFLKLANLVRTFSGEPKLCLFWGCWNSWVASATIRRVNSLATNVWSKHTRQFQHATQNAISAASCGSLGT